MTIPHSKPSRRSNRSSSFSPDPRFLAIRESSSCLLREFYLLIRFNPRQALSSRQALNIGLIGITKARAFRFVPLSWLLFVQFFKSLFHLCFLRVVPRLPECGVVQLIWQVLLLYKIVCIIMRIFIPFVIPHLFH